VEYNGNREIETKTCPISRTNVYVAPYGSFMDIGGMIRKGIIGLVKR
jgi:hypothetical protein